MGWSIEKAIYRRNLNYLRLSTPPYQQIFIEISIFAKCSIVFRVNTFSKEESKFLKSDTAAVRPKATFTVKMQR